MSKTITKADIVQRLLNDKQITAEEAVILLMNTDHQLERKERSWPFPNPWFNVPGMPTGPNPYDIVAKSKDDKSKK